MRIYPVLAAIAAVVIASTCQARPDSSAPSSSMDTEAIRAQIHSIRPEADIQSIRPAPFPGYSVVIADSTALYASNDGRYLIVGSVLDTKEHKDLSADYAAEARKSAINSIKDVDKIVFAPKYPKYTVVVFTDTTCGYCKKLHDNAQSYLDAGISIEYVAWPRAGLKSDTYRQMQSVWCSANPQAAYGDAMDGKMPTAAPTCSAGQGIADIYRLGQQIGIRGTPSIYDLEGRHLGGYLPASSLLAKLESAGE